MIYVISDTHFNHDKIRVYTNRPFNSVGEMNNALINKWNATVPKRGTVYHIGDFGFGDKIVLLNIAKQLHGDIQLILGNHDMRNNISDNNIGQHLKILGQTYILYYNKKNILLIHDAEHIDKVIGRKILNGVDLILSGHAHHSWTTKTIDGVPAVNVSVENIGYRPILLDELLHALHTGKLT